MLRHFGKHLNKRSVKDSHAHTKHVLFFLEMLFQLKFLFLPPIRPIKLFAAEFLEFLMFERLEEVTWQFLLLDKFFMLSHSNFISAEISSSYFYFDYFL